MFLVRWYWEALHYLGLHSKTGKLVFLGLDNSGKTTLLHVLQNGHAIQPQPTLHPTSQTLNIGNIDFTTFDLGGHAQARRVWKQYFPAVNGIVFLVDCNDRARMEEARAELQGLLFDDQVKDVPVLILGNKIDIPGAANEQDMRYALQLNGVTTGKGPSRSRPVELFMCSVRSRQGYGDGFKWLSQYL